MSYKIYSIKSKSNPDLQYIGSTKQSLKERLRKHKYNYKSYLNGKYNFVTSFNILKYGDYYIELYCETGTDDRSDAHWFEGLVIRAESCINKFVPGRTAKEYREQNKDKIKEYKKEYREQNKEYFKEYRKEYREQNKEYFKEYRKEYLKQKYTCECGGSYNMSNRAKHIKTNKHQNFIK